MRTQAERDAQTLTIATAGVIFVGPLAAGLLLLWIVTTVADPDRATVALAFWIITSIAALAAGGYLVRHRP